MKNTVTLALAAILTAHVALSQSFQPQVVPASSKVAAKIDFDKTRSLPTCNALATWLFANVDFMRQEGAILSKSMGITIPDDLSALVVFSDGFAPTANNTVSVKNSSSYVRGKFDEARIDKAIRAAPGFKSAKAGSREAVTATFSRGAWFAFPEKSTMLVSSGSEAAKAALGVYDKTAPSISPTSPIAAELVSQAPLAAVAIGGDGSSNLKILTHGVIPADADLIVARVTEDASGTATAKVEMTFPSAETADKIYKTINGLKLLAAFNANGVEGLVQEFMAANVAVDGNKVTFQMNVTAADLAKLKK